MAGQSRTSRSDNEPWRIGLLFSRSGIMELVETEHFRGSALAVEEINLAGGVLGRDIEPVCYDPATSPDLYRRFRAADRRGRRLTIFAAACRPSARPSCRSSSGNAWYPSLYGASNTRPT
jgi:branched-chain amino acid transport system substrate-binding protein